ncbi:MAG: hypothetical protein WA705_08750 [Candidatus Ozemobacteraceae bacterium]
MQIGREYIDTRNSISVTCRRQMGSEIFEGGDSGNLGTSEFKMELKKQRSQKLPLSNEFYRQTPTNVELSGGGGPMAWQQKDKTNQKGS